MWRRLRDRDLEPELCAHLELEAAEQKENGLAGRRPVRRQTRARE
jgi:hypothetical protein